MILAKKGNLRKRFHEHAWNLLKDKNGWVPVVEEEVKIVQTIKTPPPSGSKIADDSKIPAGPQIVKNITEDLKSQSASIGDSGKKPDSDEFKTAEDFKVFAKSNFTKSNLKDYFDKPEVNIAYKNNMSHDDLIDLLAKKFNNDLDALKVEFNIETSAADNENSFSTGL